MQARRLHALRLGLWLLLLRPLDFRDVYGQSSGTAADERASLNLLKGSIDNWVEFRTSNGLRGWDESPTCTWSGVSCNAGSQVTKINLGCYGCQRQAIGRIAPDVGNLTALQQLDLSNQFLTGPLPESWSFYGMMNALQLLNLSHNRLTGTLPAWSVGSSLPNLETLVLSSNQLTGSLPALWGAAAILPSMRILHLENNSLSGELPEAWAEDVAWPALLELGLSNNNLTGTIPEEWVRSIPSLQTLALSNNDLGGAVPGAIGEPSALRVLDLSRNMFDGVLPTNWSSDGASNLSELYLNDCDFGGQLPPEWGAPGAFPALRTLSLENNRIEGALPPEWSQEGAFPQLADLNLENNWLMDRLEAAWGAATAFPQLQRLRLGYNAFYKQLPAAWGQNGSFPALQSLDLSANYLTGTLPGSWGAPGAFVSLSNLSLVWNRLSGPIPAAWGELPSLTTLWTQPGNYQLCRGLPAGSHASLCKASGGGPCAAVNSLGSTCGVRPPSAAQYLPPSDTTTGLRATLRLENSSTLSTNGVAGAVTSALMYVMTSAQSLHVVELSQPKAAPAPATGRALLETVSGSGTAPPAVGSRHRRSLREAAAAVAADSPSSERADILDVVVQLTAARDSNIYKMESQLLTLLNSRALLNILASAGFALSGVSLLAAEPEAEGDLPAWWTPVAAWDPDTAAAAAPTAGGRVPAVRVDSDARQDHHVVIAVSVVGAAIFASTALGIAWVVARKRKQLAAEPEDPSGSKGHAERSPQRRSSGDGGADSLEDTSFGPTHGSTADSSALTVLQRRQSKLGEPPSLEHGPATSLRLPPMPWSDWEIAAAEIEICRRPGGQLWELGSGSFGRVYKAMRSGSQPVAVKILHERGDGPGFEQEIALLKACRHSNIVAFQGVCIQDNRTMLVTEFLEGGDLFRALSHPSAREMLRWRCCGRTIALDVARGLHYLHLHSVVHFDLKSHNILLSRDGTAKITDVGLARVADDGYISRLDSVFGTFAWAAPELLLGLRCTEKVDIYSFGVLLWELAVTSHTGERPQRGQLGEVRVPEHLPADVEVLRQDCMEADPALRPTAREIYDRLSAAEA